MSRSTEFFRRLSGPSAFPWFRRSLLLTVLPAAGLLLAPDVEERDPKEQEVNHVREGIRQLADALKLYNAHRQGEILTDEEINEINADGESALLDYFTKKRENEIWRRLKEIASSDFKQASPEELQQVSDEIMALAHEVPFDQFDYLFIKSELLSTVSYEPLHLDLLSFYLDGIETGKLDLDGQFEIDEESGEFQLKYVDKRDMEWNDQQMIIHFLSIFYNAGATDLVRSRAKQAMEYYLGHPRSIWIFWSLLMNSKNTPEFQNLLLEHMLLDHLFSFSDPVGHSFERLHSEEGQLIVLSRYQKWIDDLLSGSPSDSSLSLIESYWKKEAIDRMKGEAKGEAVLRQLKKIEFRLKAVEKFIKANTPDQNSGKCSCKCEDLSEGQNSKRHPNYLMP